MNMKYGLIFLFLLVGGCQGSLDFPPVKEYNEVTRVDKYQEQHAILVGETIFDIKPGTLFRVYPFWRWSIPGISPGYISICGHSPKNRFNNSEVHWRANDKTIKDWKKESQEYIENGLINIGYDVVTTRETLFDQNFVKARAELFLGARIIDIKLNLCPTYNILTGNDDHKTCGNAYIKVNWELYDSLRKKRLGNFITESTSLIETPQESGVDLLVLEALQEAAKNLGSMQAFHDTVMGREVSYPKNTKSKFSLLTLETRQRLFHKPIKENFYFMRRAVLTIRSGSGFGSGFYINEDGYALTNYHVVGEAKTVSIVDFTGTTYMADVIRVDELRDVALIKARISSNSSLPLQVNTYPQMMDKVYAIGTPVNESFKVTVTEGIISKTTMSKKEGQGYLQASALIGPGSSGGPLVNEQGNVVAISVKGVRSMDDNVTTPLARFIPIKDALKSLNIKIVKSKY